LAVASACLALAATHAPNADAAAGFQVGAARVDTTPPAYSASQDATGFPGCNTAVYDGPRQFAFEEPYIDSDGSGDFSYLPSGGDGLAPEPFCDANGNGRWDGIYSSGGVDHLAKDVHDPIDARAIAVSEGSRTVVVVSVVAQGIFKDYIDRARAEAESMRPGISDVIVSANHNESSPDTIGIYGAPAVPHDVPVLGGAVGLHSGIDDYYMSFLVDRIAQAAVNAYDRLQPATLWARSAPLPSNVRVRLSNNFPTTDDAGQPAAIDPNLRVLQARDAKGHPIATVMNLAAHNQEIGHSSDPALQDDLSSDWPGYFASTLEHQVGGMAMFLVADNGSEEDPQSVPAVPSDPAHDCPDGCYAQAQATGDALAADTAAAAAGASRLQPGPITSARRNLFVPLENNLFAGAAALGLFGDRQLYTAGQPTGRVGQDLLTEVGLVGIGPDLQILANPGEAFPALMLGSPWGIEDAGCPERPNPPVPTWRAPATFRFQAGLADDMIGYESPAWAYSSLPGALDYNGAPATCFDDQDDRDPAGHQHKLETEGAGPTAGNLVASNLADLVAQHPDPRASVVRGRYVFADGTTSRLPSHGGDTAVAIWVAPPGSTSLTPGEGRIIALPGVRSFGSVRVNAHGRFMDFDGQPQGAPDITTRGMLAGTAKHPGSRSYLDLYPSLTAGTLPPAREKRR
jgi:hypothetical protein